MAKNTASQPDLRRLTLMPLLGRRSCFSNACSAFRLVAPPLSQDVPLSARVTPRLRSNLPPPIAQAVYRFLHFRCLALARPPMGARSVIQLALAR
jgi:hypothetical protein